MASNCAGNLVRRSTNAAKTFFSRSQSVEAGPSKLSGLSPRHRPTFSRLPVELGCAVSLMPLHSVTASALLKSMLSSKVGSWSFLSEVELDRPMTIAGLATAKFTKSYAALQHHYNDTS